MSVIHSPGKPELDFRVLVFPMVLAPLLFGLFLRLWYLQVVQAPVLAERAEISREMKVPKLAPRGLVYDRRGTLVAGVKPELVVTAVPNEIRKHPESLLRLAAILGVEKKRLEEKIEDAPGRYMPVPLYTGATIAQGTKIAEIGEGLPGVAIETKPLRWYPDTLSFTHVLGYTRLPGDKDVERLKEAGIEPSEYVGSEGIERAYERELMGQRGSEILEVDAKRRPVRVSGREAAIPGEGLLLSLDADLQRFAAKTVAGAGMKGGVVAIEPATGEILAMVSVPSYDQKLFEGGSISRADWKRLQDDPNKPLLNRAIASQMAPGSTFKIVTSIAAMESGKFSPYWSAYCNGAYKIGRGSLKCLGHHGAISFNRAMEKSCNVYFCTLGRSVGEDGLRKAALDCGLGNRTGLEIVGERRGVIPTQKWLDLHHRTWVGGDTVNMSVGQGYVAATPLQMANLAALVANDGTSYKPHLLHAVRESNGKMRGVAPEIGHHVEGPAEFWRTLKGGLHSVIQTGTARGAQIPGVQWGGKTGSAEHGNKSGKTHAWFVGFAPLTQPKIAICVFAEGAGHGGDFAAPIAGKIVAHYLAEEARRSKSRAAATSRSKPSSSVNR